MNTFWQPARHGNHEAYSQPFDRFGHELLRFAAYLVWDAQDAEDIVQEAFLRLFDTERKKLLRQSNGSAHAFLKATVRHLCVDRIRKREIHKRYTNKEAQVLEDQDPAHHDTPLRWHTHNVLEQNIMQALEQLPDMQRACFVLRVLEEESYAAIAKALEIGVDSVKTHIHRAKAKLRDVLSEPSHE